MSFYNDPETIRQQIKTRLADGQQRTAWGLLIELIDRWPSLENMAFAAHCFKEMHQLPVQSVKIGVVSSFTLATMQPYLEVEAMRAGLRCEVWYSPYGDWRRVIDTPASPLYTFQPDLLYIALRPQDLQCRLADRLVYLQCTASDVQDEVHFAADSLATMFRTLRQHLAAPVVVHNFVTPSHPASASGDTLHTCSQQAAFRQLNERLLGCAREYSDVYVLDIDQLASEVGKESWQDVRFAWADMAIAPKHLPRLATEYARFLVALIGRTRKALVLDLDNTLWRGILAEDGVENLQVDAAFARFQDEVRYLKEKGIFLAINSKNTEQAALHVIDALPDMRLRTTDFSAMHIQDHAQTDKVEGLTRIAQDLHISLDSVVFIDDSPWECSQVRTTLPEVRVLQPESPEHAVRMLQTIPNFEALVLTEEGRHRTETWRAEQQLAALAVVPNLDERRRRAAPQLTVEPVTPFDVTRAAELVMRVNRFNLTGRRYSKGRIESLLKNRAWHLFQLRLVSLGTDFGRVGLALAVEEDDVWRLDNVLASCRIPSELEVQPTFLLSIMRLARQAGIQRMIGEFIPTAKNSQIRDFYEALGFHAVGQTSAGGHLWHYDLTHELASCPSHLTVVVIDPTNPSREQGIGHES